ncbi:MAG: hypothetical protein LBC59_07530 [Chitinispirillales bacterium]|jgi:hypothetical protein|nr:hypothetical protein [Chitinispirillales bacterium]
MKMINTTVPVLMLLAAFAVGYASTPEFAAPDPAEEIPAEAKSNGAAAAAPGESDSDSDLIPQRLGILGAEVFLYDVSSGGIFEYRDDWSKLASRRAVISAALALTGMGYDPTVVPDAAMTREIFNLKTKMRYHCMAFRSRFYGDRSMYVTAMNAASDSAKIGAFYSSTLVDTVKYSIGSADSLCNLYGVDGFVYVYGFQENRNFRQMRLKGAVPVPDRGRTYIAAILVGRDGRVLWYKDIAVTGTVDLRADKYSAGIVGALFE